ncbi:MAG: AAA family ATPase [Clostridia bacterium]|nr:AAA family ATPase [Clostridia bacterium]
MTKIASLEIENVKRVKAVALEPSQNGLTVIGGRNGQGKTSVLDSIAWALGGDKYRPSNAQREGSVLPPMLRIELSNGLVVERKGKNSDLKVIDTNGNRAGQTLLNEFVEQFALDLPRFMQASNKDKARTLLQIIGIGDALYEMDQQEALLYNQRHAIGQIADQKEKFAAEMTEYSDVPKEPVSASELIRQQQEILARNGMRQQWKREQDQIHAGIMRLQDEIESTECRLRDLRQQLAEWNAKDLAAQKSPAEMQMESTEELERNIAEIEAINIKIRSNLDKEKAEEDAKAYREKYDSLTAQIENIRSDRMKLLDSADLPLQGLSVADGELIYNGAKWDCMSGADQLRVATAIVRKLNPKCGFVLIDKLEQMDSDTLREFGAWLESEGLQAIATRVSTGEECSIIIEDGYVAASEPSIEQPKGGYWS